MDITPKEILSELYGYKSIRVYEYDEILNAMETYGDIKSKLIIKEIIDDILIEMDAMNFNPAQKVGLEKAIQLIDSVKNRRLKNI